MRTSPDHRSPWGQRVWFDDREFEDMMDEVRTRAGDSVFEVGSGVDVDAILLKVYGVSPDFRDLDEGVLGRTEFHRDGRLDVRVSRRLANEAEMEDAARRRLRSTLGHECGHIALHRHLYVLPGGESLFPESERSQPEPRVLCRTSVIDQPRRVPSADWWEYQANRAMAALLLPQSLLDRTIGSALETRNLKDMRAALAQGYTEGIIHEIMSAFDVSFEMTLYRLQSLGHLPKSDHPELELG